MKKVEKKQFEDFTPEEQAKWPLTPVQNQQRLTTLQQKHAKLEDIKSEDFDFVYKDATVFKQLREDFKDQCAYCESKLDFATSYFPVEHYRPKTAYKTLDDKKDKCPGYWWLAYEWSNLLLSCQVCNTYKSTYFPLADEAKRDIPNKKIEDEDPLILSPVDDNPYEHIVFRCEYALAKDGSPKGQTTIDKCKLNRPELVNSRLNKWLELQKVKKQCEDIVAACPDSKMRSILKEVLSLVVEKKRQALMAECFTGMFENQIND